MVNLLRFWIKTPYAMGCLEPLGSLYYAMNGNPKDSHGIWMRLAQFLEIHVCSRTKFPREHDRRILQVLLRKKSMAGLAAVISFTASSIAISFRSYKIVTCTVRATL